MAKALSHTVNELFGAYVAIEAEQIRLGNLGTKEADEEANALASPALALMEQINTIRDRSGNADLSAAIVLLELMLTNRWDRVVPGYQWRFDEEKNELRALERVADRTTGAVREHTAKALATIGVELAPEADDPLIRLVRDYRAGLAAYNASGHQTSDEDETLAAVTMNPPWHRLRDDCPVPTTMEGVIEGVRLLNDELNEGGSGGFELGLLGALVTYLDRRAA